MNEKKEIFKKLFELGVHTGLHADYLFEKNKINESERSIAWNLRMPSNSLNNPPNISISSDPPLLYPKWCYDELKFGSKRDG